MDDGLSGRAASWHVGDLPVFESTGLVNNTSSGSFNDYGWTSIAIWVAIN